MYLQMPMALRKLSVHFTDSASVYSRTPKPRGISVALQPHTGSAPMMQGTPWRPRLSNIQVPSRQLQDGKSTPGGSFTVLT